MSLLTKIGFLPEPLETVLYPAREKLGAVGVERLTPLGILYLLLVGPVTGQQVALIAKKDQLRLAEAAETELQTRYYGLEGGFWATQETLTLLDKAIEEAGGGINQAGAGHLVLAMFTMERAKGTDAHKFLKKHGVTKKKVEQALKKGIGVSAVHALFQDIRAEVTAWGEPIVATETLETQLAQLVTILSLRRGANALILEQEGSGRHTLLRHLVLQTGEAQLQHRAAQDGIRKFEKWIFLRLRMDQLRRQKDIRTALLEAIEGLENTIIVVDGLTAKDYPLVRTLLAEGKVPVIIITSEAEAKTLEGQDVSLLHRLAIKEPGDDELRQIIKAVVDPITRHHGLARDLDKRALDALIQHGPAVTGLANPGAAVRLLDMAAASDGSAGDRKLNFKDIARVIHREKGISIGALTEGLRRRIHGLVKKLSLRVIGHNHVKVALYQALARKIALGDEKDKRPIGVIFELGPTGVGKTLMAKALAAALFDDEDAVLRFDMSEFAERHTIARLIGSPPGYIGYHRGGQLTEAIRRTPYCVVCFDEIDKAHPDVCNVLLQLMDEGRLTDGRGFTADFTHAVIILTSNYGSPFFAAAAEGEMSFEQAQQAALAWLKTQLRPEFLNRIDEIVVFHPLTREDCEQILDLDIDRLVTKPFAARGITVEVSPEALTFILESQLEEIKTYGARPLERAIRKYIVNPLAIWIVEQRLGEGQQVRCTVDQTVPGGPAIVFEEG